MEWLLLGSGALGTVGWILWLVQRNKVSRRDAEIKDLNTLIAVKDVKLAISDDKARRLELVRADMRKELDAWLDAAEHTPGRDSVRMVVKRLLQRSDSPSKSVPDK